MIIDFHTHAWPDKVSQKARESLESLFRVKLITDPTVSELLRFMDKNGIDISVVCAVATRPEQVPSINDWVFTVRQERIRVYCALHPGYERWDEELTRIAGRGDGVKFQPEFQKFYVDDPEVFPLYARMEELGIPALFHCGEELSRTMLVRSSPERIRRIRECFPRMKIVAAHFGGFGLLESVERYLLGLDIYIDTSFFFPFVSREKARALLMKHPKERILFGTDFPLIDQIQDLEHLRGLSLPADLEERILFRNARELLGIG
jgi:uncharacterized protein